LSGSLLGKAPTTDPVRKQTDSKHTTTAVKSFIGKAPSLKQKVINPNELSINSSLSKFT